MTRLFLFFTYVLLFEVQHLQSMRNDQSLSSRDAKVARNLKKLLELKERLEQVENRLTERRDKMYRRLGALSRTKRGTCVGCEAELLALLFGSDVDKGECYEDVNGTDYRGEVGVTNQGETCQNWNTQTPHSHEYEIDNPISASAGIGDHNYCRNPDHSNKPWCYTMDAETRSQYCDIGTVSSPGTCPFDYRLNKGATYTIYGQTTCPNDSEKVYSGFVAGGRSCDFGGGNTFMCMPSVPKYNEIENRVQSNRAYVAHTQYRNPLRDIKELNNGDPPCVICQTPTRTSIIMLPAKNECPDRTWHLEYAGYLFAQKNFRSRRGSQYICVSKNALEIAGTESYISGANHLYHVEARCSTSINSAMACDGSYVDGFEFTCAVCSK